jgi:hypothetical protein
MNVIMGRKRAGLHGTKTKEEIVPQGVVGGCVRARAMGGSNKFKFHSDAKQHCKLRKKKVAFRRDKMHFKGYGDCSMHNQRTCLSKWSFVPHPCTIVL